MKKIKINIKYLLYLTLVILAIYQNCIFGKFMGEYGKYPILYISLILCFLMLCFRKIKVNKTIISLFFLGIMLFIISIVSNVIYLLINHDIILLRENIFIKSIFGFITYYSYLSILVLFYNLTKNMPKKFVFKPFFIASILLCIIGLIELFTIPYAFTFIPTINTYPYYRVRLLTTESSLTSLLIITYSALSLIYSLISRKKTNIIISSLSTLFLILTSESKGIYVLIIFMVIILFINIRSKLLRSKSLIILILLIASICVFFGVKFFSALNQDLRNYTSFITRSYTIVVAFILSIIYPFGIGNAVYMSVFPQALEKYLPFVKELAPNLNFSEILSYINATTDVAVTPKSGLSAYSIYWGIFGTLLFLNIMFSLKPRHSDAISIILRLLFYVSILSITFLNDFKCEFWIFCSILIYYKETNFTTNVEENCNERNNISRR